MEGPKVFYQPCHIHDCYVVRIVVYCTATC